MRQPYVWIGNDEAAVLSGYVFPDVLATIFITQGGYEVSLKIRPVATFRFWKALSRKERQRNTWFFSGCRYVVEFPSMGELVNETDMILEALGVLEPRSAGDIRFAFLRPLIG